MKIRAFQSGSLPFIVGLLLSGYVRSQCALGVTLNITPPSCFACCDGSVTAIVNNGCAPYSYSWTPPGGMGPTLTNICAGNYTFSVQDNGCCAPATQSFVVSNGPTLTREEEGTDYKLLISPNPSNGIITLYTPDDGEHFILIKDAGGRLLYQDRHAAPGNIVTFHHHLPSGMYFLSVRKSGTNKAVEKKLLIWSEE